MQMGVIGSGSIGMRHARILSDLGFEVEILTSSRARATELVSMGWKAGLHWDSFAPGVKSGFIIASETRKHREQLIRLSAHSIPILVEKPLAPSLADFEFIEHQLTQAQLQNIRVACPFRFHPGISWIGNLLPSLGRIHTVTITCQSYLPDWRKDRDYKKSYSADPLTGGVIRDLVHEIDYCGYLFGWPPPDSVKSVSSRGTTIGIQSTANASIIWKNTHDSIFQIDLNYLTRKPRRAIHVFGESGELEFDFIQNEGTHIPVDREPQRSRFSLGRDDVMKSMLNAFVSGASDGCTYLDAKKTQAVVDMCHKSEDSSI